MEGKTGTGRVVSRRSFLKRMRWAPVLFLPGQIHSAPFTSGFSTACTKQKFLPAPANASLIPHYPAKPSLDDLLRHVMPGLDGFVHEKDAYEIAHRLDEWSQELRAERTEIGNVAKLLSYSIEVTVPVPIQEMTVRSQYGVEVLRRRFAPKTASTSERFVQQLRTYLADIAQLDTAEFLVVKLQEVTSTSSTFDVDIRYDLVGTRKDARREQRVGTWRTQSASSDFCSPLWLQKWSGKWRRAWMFHISSLPASGVGARFSC